MNSNRKPLHSDGIAPCRGALSGHYLRPRYFRQRVSTTYVLFVLNQRPLEGSDVGAVLYSLLHAPFSASNDRLGA
jgi:hypothetical protein